MAGKFESFADLGPIAETKNAITHTIAFTRNNLHLLRSIFISRSYVKANEPTSRNTDVLVFRSLD